MNLSQTLNIFAPLDLTETTSPSIRHAAEEPSNWWRLGETDVAKAIRDNLNKHPVDIHNLLHRIEIYAGGPGSGCTGPNCGRPPTGRNKDYFVYSKGGKAEVAEINRELRELRRRAARGSGVKGKDRKRVKLVIKLFQEHLRNLGRQLYRTNPPDVKINPKPVKKAQVVQQHTLANGVKYTIVKANPRGRPAGSGNYAKQATRPHSQKGGFRPTYTDMTPPGQDARVSVYDTQKAGTTGAGSTVIVTRDFGGKRAVVQEMSRGQFGHLDALLQQFKFKNFGQAAGMLNKRYGITQRLPKR